MKRFLLPLVVGAFALSFAPEATAAPAVATSEVTAATAELPFFKKNKKSSKARYKQMKRNKGSYAKKVASRKKKARRY
ncbi:hypothetical protein [Rufibacter psychrotolerans]|uniref:hypothetical protein n=1 Tax=Rufibacter psychrotolerans TaxID=2812556 RepID=UPI001966DC21|nr:hypothetical protein [Rufibacter sp. SYSU D00308]